MSNRFNFLISIIILSISAVFIIPACNISDPPKYTQGSGILLKNSEHKPSIPQNFNQLKDRLDALMPGILAKYDTVGAAVALIEPKRDVNGERLYDDDGKLIYEDLWLRGYGKADLIHENRLNPVTTVFQIASLSKPVGAWGVRLMENMRDQSNLPLIDLDAVIDPVEPMVRWPAGDDWQPTGNGYLKNWHFTNTTPVDKREWINLITIRHLIRHRAGLTRNDYIGFIQSPGSLNSSTPYKDMPSLLQCLNGFMRLKDFPRGFCPKVKIMQSPDTRPHESWQPWYLEDGTGWIYNDIRKEYLYNGQDPAQEEDPLWKYSSGGYTVLQLIVEERTGKNFVDYMSENVFLPLGMDSTTYTYSKDLNLATPYRRDPVEESYLLHTAKACGGLYTTAPDFAKFIIKMMEKAPGDDGQWECDKTMEPSAYCIITENDAVTYRDKSFCREDKLNADHPGAASFLESVGYIGEGDSPDKIKKKFIYRHFGTLFGWDAVMAFIPEQKIGLLVFTNTSNVLYYTGKGVCKEVFDAWASTAIQVYGD